jgi:hypothetical protein
MMDQPLSSICDRVIYTLIRKRGLSHGSTGLHTVYFRSMYSHHYTLAGKLRPQSRVT